MFGMWNDWVVGSSGCGMFEMWNVHRCEMLGIQDYLDAGCSKYEMFRMWDVWNVGCWGYRIFKM